MSSAKSKPTHTTPADSTRAVDDFMAKLEHPCKAGVEALRRLMLGLDAGIAEGIKWNTPSFRTGEYFATTHLRGKTGFGVVLHLGAKVRESPAGGFAIDDPSGLLKWLGPDRAMVEFERLADFNDKKAEFERIVRRWIVHVR
ncbi:DUF1801 domain-containing protein [Lysobacter cavernae]|uniref:DUF1801 domain-containing protein n=1 Tax=Lysobacter cavernae TaxID=1685901 RepID=A0ABV7RRT7_9GAMM